MTIRFRFSPLFTALIALQSLQLNAAALEEVIVTAQKRAESAQDVPIAITAFSGDAIENRNIFSAKDLQKFTPGLRIAQQDASKTFIRMRGVGSRKFDVGSEGSVGVFVDELYLPRFSNADIGLLDLQRVEVLRGPQGTLFGRNTAAGAISVWTRRPSQEQEAYLEAGAGNEDSYIVRGAASGGVTDKLSLRLALGKQEQGGFQRNTLTGTTDNRINTTARFQGLYDQSDTLTILGSIQYTKREQDALLQKNISTLPDGAIMPLFGSPILKFAANDDFRDYPITHDGGIDFDTVMATLRIEKEFGGFNLVATSGYLDGDGGITQDFDGNEAAIAIIPWEEEYDTLSQEIRLVGKNWLVGVYYYSDDAASSYVFDWHAESLQGLLTRGAGKRDNVPIEVETTSWAAFGEYTLDFSEQWALSLGGRYSTDEKDWVLAGETTLPGLPVVLAPYVYDDGDDWDSFDPKVALKYRVNDDVLAYFTYSEGYKAGGVQFTAITEALARQVFDPEELSAYELGVKSDLMDNTLRVNATAFYYDYQDLQVQRVDTEVSGGLPVAFTSNAAESEISGLELDINWLPNEALDFRLAYAYLDTEYVDYIGPGGVDFSGNPLPNSPKHTLIGSIGYTTTLPGNWTLNLGTDWTFTDEHNFDVLDDDPFTKEDSYTLGAARLAVISPDQKWTVTAYVKNLTDEEYYSQMTRRSAEVIASAADGRRFGLRVRYDF